MKKFLGLILMVALVFTMVVAPVAAAGNVYNMGDAEWGVQGSKGWFYYSYDGKGYDELDFDDESGARFLVGDDYTGAYQYLELYPTGGHPCVEATISAVRGFKVPTAGKVEITWSVAPSNASYYVFDGVGIAVMKNSTKVFPASGDIQSVNETGSPYPSGGDNDYIATPRVFTFTADVAKDDMLYFHLYNNGSASYDRTKYDITIKYLDSSAPAEAGTESAAPAADSGSSSGTTAATQKNPKTSDPVSVYGLLSLAALGATGVVIRFKKK